MNIRKISPQDLIPDNASYYVRNGLKIRKGTMALAVANVEILQSSSSSLEEKAKALKVLQEIVPQLNAFGLNEHFVWRNPKTQAIFDAAFKKGKNS